MLVNFTSLGSTAMDPAWVKFTYANYDTPQTVTVSGIDDSIDQGLWYEDHIDLNFTSTDECKDSSSRELPCGQYVGYNGFNGKNSADGKSLRMNVNVTDDDMAGVQVTTTHVNTTIDNRTINHTDQ